MKVMSQSELKNVNGGLEPVTTTLVVLGGIATVIALGQAAWEFHHRGVEGWNEGW